jgi:hypothetical protein
MEHIRQIVVDLENKTNFGKQFYSYRMTLLRLISCGQSIGRDLRRAEEIEKMGATQIPDEFYFAKEMSRFAIRIYKTSHKDSNRLIRLVMDLEEEEDVVVKPVSDSAGHNLPKFMILLDHRNRSVVLTIRGTNSPEDVLTDLLGKPVDFCGGLAHEGAKIGAEGILARTKSKLKFLLNEKFPNYKFVVTGHSLGAGIAVLISLKVLLSNELNIDKDRLKCIALAPPPVFHPSRLPDQISNKIEIYIHGNDCVPSLSLAVIKKLLLTMEKVDNLKLSYLERGLALLKKAIVVDHLVETYWRIRDCQTDPSNQTTRINCRDAEIDEPTLQHPGTVFYFHRPRQGSKQYSLCQLPGDQFSEEVSIRRGMLSDHFQWNYEAAFASVAGEVGRPRDRFFFLVFAVFYFVVLVPMAVVGRIFDKKRKTIDD